jgi:glycosyltransferase involved in cell wall biosynthesis
MHPSAGGPPVVVERLSLLLPSEGWDASVITTSLYCHDDGKSLRDALAKRIDVEVLPIRAPRDLKRAYGAVDVIERAVRESDVVHLHTLWHPLNTIARKVCQRHGRKYALMPHGMLDPYSLKQKRWRKKIYLAAVERRNLQGASRLVFTTDHERQAAKESLPWLTQDEIIPLAADFPPNVSRELLTAEFTNLFPRVLGRRCILFLGRIDPKKGLERLMRILPQISTLHPEVLLVIAGTGEANYVAHVRQLVRLGDLERQVLFTGLLVGRLKWGALACSEIFVLPSRQENFAISMVEAMQMALPVIITDKVNSWPFVKAANAGFVVEEERIEEGLMLHLDALLRAPELGRCFGNRGKLFARKHFTWQRVARDMVSLYRDVLSE